MLRRLVPVFQPTRRGRLMARRRVEIGKNDLLVLDGTELDAGTLYDIINPTSKRRALWAFIKNDDGDIRPVCFTEDRVIWLQDSDLARTEDVASA
jgi:hypothetical protein